jgi:signal transduction histidine kinase
VSHNLMPDELTTLGLAGALAETARRLQEALGIRFLFVNAGQVRPLLPTAKLALYRAVLELMHNIVRHSQATEAVVQLVYHDDLLNITIEDNGRGFDTKK